FAAAESAPFIKTGGLGSVIGSLPRELNHLGVKVSLVIPGYECIGQEYLDRMDILFSFPVKLGWRESMADLAYLRLEDMDCYFICNSGYYCGDSPYSDIWLDVEKFAFFSKAVLEMLSYLELPVDIIHCHDWQTGLLPVFLRTMYGHDPYYKRIKTILTIHNMKFQGITEIDRMKDITGLPDHVFTYDKLECYGYANMLKGGIAYADLISTVSRTYAREIQTPEYGEGLFQSLYFRREDLYGIVNGIDWIIYDPETDGKIKENYSVKDFPEKRPENKLALQHLAGLPENKDTFAMGIVSRLTEQKGYDLLEGTLDSLFDQGAQLYVLGEGEDKVEKIFRSYKEKYPGQIYLETAYQDAIAKMIYAGCDITLMPSRFEPCGLNQMMAQRYGCLPLVRATGGLKDTVRDDGLLTGEGTGFVFDRYDKKELNLTLKRAYSMYKDHPKEWALRIEKGMREDFSWTHSAKAYEKMYFSLMEDKEKVHDK
ncbi:MAG: glycogen synthase, partial [Eubacterium sp.]|nr:glycogen synthase [Eubacterium sp.]